MKQLSGTEKQELEAKIQAEQERQQGLQETNPNIPTTSTENKFTPSNLWKYSALGVILFLIVFNVFLFVMSGNSESNKSVVKMNLVVALMLLFNHIAFTFTKTGWKSRVMKTVAFVWIAFGFAYILWVVTSSGLLAR